METSCSNRTGGQPPVLPVKQLRHRSLSYRGPSVGSDCVPLSPGLQPPNYTDVFESTDCHADSCPIHQDLDSIKHQVRFLSDGTPPPVPKKRLARTFSLPADHVPSLPPNPPLQMHPRNFDNPLYMLTPMWHFSEEPSEFGAGTRSGTAPLLPLSHLSFDTSDEHLVNFFANFEDKDAVSKTIQHCHLLFLRDKAQNINADMLLKEKLSEKLFNSYQPQNFLLDEGSGQKPLVGTVFYSVHSPKFPGRTLGLKIYTQMEKPASSYTNPIPAHVNVKHIVAHFQPTSNMKETQALDSSSVSGCSAAKVPRGCSNEYANCSLVSTVQHLLWRGHCVSVERDRPLATLEDFVQESHCLQNMDCVLYDKRICFLLLQILQGSQHLHRYNLSGPSLTPSEIFLVWPGIEKEKPKSSEGNQKESDMYQLQKGNLNKLWETLGCPRVVVSPQTAPPSTFQTMGALIQYCLNVHEGLAALYMSVYRKALLYVASLYKDNSETPNINDMVNVLQVVLWGPGLPLLQRKGLSTVHSWLTMKRALYVMKLAEKGVDQTALDWEDFLCLQYVAFTDPETMVNVTSCHFTDIQAGEWGQ